MTDEELRNALNGLYAHDSGSTDTGIHDEALRERCIKELRSRTGSSEIGPRIFLSRFIRDMWLSEDALEQGYGIEDVLSFARWLGEYMGIEF